MQTKSSKVKISKKTSEILSSLNLSQNQYQSESNLNEFIQVGAICGDGTFTQYTGRGAGSHHNGIKHKVYARRCQLTPNQKPLVSKPPIISSSTISQRSEQNNNKKQQKQSNVNVILSSSSQKKKLKKISLKDYFKTKTKKSALYEKVHFIFETLYKDQLQFVEEELNDQLWLVFSAISNLYDQLQDSNNLIKELQKVQQLNNKQPITKPQQNHQLIDTKALQLQIFNLTKGNQSLSKQIQKLTKSNTQLESSLQEYKSKQKNFKKMLKVIEKQNPKIVNNALEQSKINVKDLKKQKKEESRVLTRSMVKRQQSNRNEQKKFQSLFSSDSSDFYDQDRTIVNLIKSMK